jgi:hypothetical protein
MFDKVLKILEDNEEVLLSNNQLKDLENICDQFKENGKDEILTIREILTSFSNIYPFILSKENIKVIIKIIEEKEIENNF